MLKVFLGVPMSVWNLLLIDLLLSWIQIHFSLDVFQWVLNFGSAHLRWIDGCDLFLRVSGDAIDPNCPVILALSLNHFTVIKFFMIHILMISVRDSPIIICLKRSNLTSIRQIYACIDPTLTFLILGRLPFNSEIPFDFRRYIVLLSSYFLSQEFSLGVLVKLVEWVGLLHLFWVWLDLF